MKFVIGKKKEPRKFRIQITEKVYEKGKTRVIKSRNVTIVDNTNKYSADKLHSIICKALMGDKK